MLKVRLKSESGFSLVELLIALTLFGVVLSVGYSLHYFGIVSFERGQEQMERQREARLVSRVLTEEIRYAREITITNDMAKIEDGQVCFLVENGSVVRVADNRSHPITSSKDDYLLNFASIKNGEQNDQGAVISVTIRSGQEANAYEISTSILALNASSVNDNNRAGSILCLSGF